MQQALRARHARRQYNGALSLDPWADLTILLPLKDRVDFTRRWLAYAATHLPCRILLADGGGESDDLRRLAADANARGSNVEYVRYPYDTDYRAYYAKIADALTRVQTRFVVLADNDDLFLPNGLREAVQFLQAHDDYVACGGQCAVFWLHDGDLASPAANRIEWKCSSRLLTETGETAEQRLRERCLGAHEVFYVVHRTDQLRRHFAAVRDCNPRDLFLMPQLLVFLTAIAGKTRQLDTLYLARQQDSPGSSGGAHEAAFGDWIDRMLVPTWSDDFTRFVQCASGALAQADGIAPERATRVVIDAYKASVAPALLSDLVEQPTVSFWAPSVLALVRRMVARPKTDPVRRFMTLLYRRSRWLSNDVVYGVEFRARRSRQAGQALAPVLDFLRADRRQSSATSGT